MPIKSKAHSSRFEESKISLFQLLVHAFDSLFRSTEHSVGKKSSIIPVAMACYRNNKTETFET